MPNTSALWQNIAGSLDPAQYIDELGLPPYDWQEEALDPTLRRVLLLCARQTGKSTIVGGKALYKAKYYPGSLILILSPTKDKSKEMMEKIAIMMTRDPYLPELVNDALFEKKFANGSRIIALPGTEKSVRGYSGPRMIILDEAALVLEETYRAARPMMVQADTEMIALTTSHGKRGWFCTAWTQSKRWHKIFVTVPWLLKDGKHFIPAMPLEQARAYWKQRGVSLYYSTRHDLNFLQEEYDEGGGELWIRQEYLCEFLDVSGGIFSEEDWRDAVNYDLEPLFPEESVINYDLPPLFEDK